MNEPSGAGSSVRPSRHPQFGCGIGRGLDRNSKPPEGQEQRGGGNREKAKVKGAGSPCEEAQTGKEISRSVIIHGLRKQPRLELPMRLALWGGARGGSSLKPSLTGSRSNGMGVVGEPGVGTDYPYRPWALKTLGFPLSAAQSWAPSGLDQGLGKHRPWSWKRALENQEAPTSLLLPAALVTI